MQEGVLGDECKGRSRGGAQTVADEREVRKNLTALCWLFSRKKKEESEKQVRLGLLTRFPQPALIKKKTKKHTNQPQTLIHHQPPHARQVCRV